MRTRTKKRVIRLILIGIGLIFIVPALWSVIYNLFRIYSLNSKKELLKEENIKLQKQISEASNEEYIEKIARIKLGLKKDNEIEYRFVSNEKEDRE